MLAHHKGTELNEGWEFYVLARSLIESAETKAFSPGGLRAKGVDPVQPAELADQVRAIADTAGH